VQAINVMLLELQKLSKEIENLKKQKPVSGSNDEMRQGMNDLKVQIGELQ